MQHRTIPPTLNLVPLALALGLAIALPAKADPAGPGCWVFHATTQAWEQDDAIDKTQGAEHGDRNSTCFADASAYGALNTARGPQSSSVGYNHTELPKQISADSRVGLESILSYDCRRVA